MREYFDFVLNSQKPKLIRVFLYLLFISILIRFPFFFPAVINWDESTFILVGQSIVDGHLLYTDLWDLKSPFTFIFFALCILLFGKSIVGVRIAGTVCVALVAYFTYLIGESIWSHRVGIISSTLFVVLASTYAYGGSTMSEHIALVPLIGALCILVTRKASPYIFFVAGLLMASAVMVRLNLAYVAVLIGIFTLFNQSKSRYSIDPKSFCTYLLGLCLPIISTYIPYQLYGHQNAWLFSVILGPLKYSKSEGSSLDALLQQIGNIFSISWANPLLCFTLVTGIVYVFRSVNFSDFFNAFLKSKESLQERQKSLSLIFVFFVGTLASILNGGASYSHYLIQIFPFIVLPTACFFGLRTYKNIYWKYIAISTFFLAIFSSILSYSTLAFSIIDKKTMNYGSAYEIASYIRKNNPQDKPIYMMTDHIVYWFLNQRPITYPVVHPSNIFSRGYLLGIIFSSDIDPAVEMQKILSKEPLYIVKKEKVFYLGDRKLRSTREILEKTLNSQYSLVKRIDDKLVYRRIY